MPIAAARRGRWAVVPEPRYARTLKPLGARLRGPPIDLHPLVSHPFFPIFVHWLALDC